MGGSKACFTLGFRLPKGSLSSNVAQSTSCPAAFPSLPSGCALASPLQISWALKSLSQGFYGFMSYV